MAYKYSNMYEINMIGLRFFTVYGPWGRPDMALFSFTDAILRNKPITIYNHGKMIRDFTFIEDVVESIDRIVKKIMSNCKENHISDIFNIGSENPMPLMGYIKVLENVLQKEAQKNFVSTQL